VKLPLAAGCALAAVVTCLAAAFAAMAPADFEPSLLVHVGSGEPMANVVRATDPHFALVPDQSHYDGVYYYAIGRDPFAQGSEHTLIDRPSYRYGHPGFGWLGWLASAGQARALPAALLAVALACAAIAGAAAALLAADLGVSPLWGLVVAFDPGLVYSVTVLTSEAAELAALLVALLAWRRGHRVWAVAAMTAGCFIKEPLVLVPAGIAIYEVGNWLRTRSHRALFARIGLLAVPPLAYLCWFVYLWWHFGLPPTDQSHDLAAVPFTGWVDTFKRAASFVGADFSTSQLGAIEVPLLVVVGFALVAGAARAYRLDTVVKPVFVLMALTVFSLTWLNLLFPKDFLRAATVPLALLPLVFAPGRPAGPLLQSEPGTWRKSSSRCRPIGPPGRFARRWRRSRQEPPTS
jgi:hypothetical protein